MILGVPFLITHPIAYIHRAFEFSRQFFYIWTVNWKCIPEPIFLSREFQLVLLCLHLSMLVLFLNKYLKCVWNSEALQIFRSSKEKEFFFSKRQTGGLAALWHKRNARRILSSDCILFLKNWRKIKTLFCFALKSPFLAIVTIMFLSNFIGICFSRSLHYQFYIWYYHTFAYLLWCTSYPTSLK